MRSTSRDGLRAAADAARLGDAVARRMRGQLVDERAHDGEDAAEQHAAGLLRDGRLGERGEHALLALRAQAGELAELLRLGGGAQLVEVRDAEVLPETPGRLRAEARDVHDVHEPGRELVAQLRERLEVARLGELDDLRLDRRADPGDLRGRPVEREPGDRRRRLADARRGAPVGRRRNMSAPSSSSRSASRSNSRRELRVRGERFGATRR